MKTESIAVNKVKMLFAALMIAMLTSVCMSGIRSQAAATSSIWDYGFTVTYDHDAGIMYIDGTGDMPDYSKKTYSRIGFSIDDDNDIHTVVIGEGITSIGDYMFYSGGDKALVTVILPSTLKRIGDYAFYYNYGLTNINFPEGLEEIGKSAFVECHGLTNVSFPSTLKTIGSKAFYCCYKLKSISLPEGLTSIGNRAFVGCESLSGSLVIPSSITEFKSKTFYCANISSITIPASVKSLSSSTFEFDVSNKLKTVYYGGTEKQWKKLTSSFSANSPLMTAKLVTNSSSLDTCKVKKLTNKTSGIEIKWNKVSDASGYYIYRKTSSGSYKKIATVKKASTTTYTDKSVKNKEGTKYTYKVVAYSESAKSKSESKSIVREK